MNEATDWSVRMADSVLARNPIMAQRWAYEWGVTLEGIAQVWQRTGDTRYFDFIKHNIDEFVQPDGSIHTYRIDEYNLDQINTGRQLFLLWHETGDSRYEAAIQLLRHQLETHPRTEQGGFWHKNIYPQQMWLDGIYMQGPFYVRYGVEFDEPAIFDDLTAQIILIEQHARDPQTGLLYHAWDSSKQQRWADPETGCSPHFWGRAIGWYMMAIPDVLDYLPADHANRDRLIEIFNTTAEAITRVQDPTSGLWFQVLDHPKREGNYLEASASSMFVYGLAKAARQGYGQHLETARRGLEGLITHLIDVDDQGLVNLNQVCSVAGLGGNPYRDGSYDYYISEPAVSNDFKGIGPFIMAHNELALAAQ